MDSEDTRSSEISGLSEKTITDEKTKDDTRIIFEKSKDDTRNILKFDIESIQHDHMSSDIIKLRKYFYEMQNIMNHMFDEQYLNNVISHDTIPEFPELTLGTCKEDHKFKKEVRFRNIDSEIEIERKNFVTNVIFQTGYHELSALIEGGLSDLLHEFLTKLAKGLWMNFKNRTTDRLTALETTLQEIGFGGILGLHNFYYQNVIKKYKVLYSQSFNIQKICNEIIVDPEKYIASNEETLMQLGLEGLIYDALMKNKQKTTM